MSIYLLSFTVPSVLFFYFVFYSKRGRRPSLRWCTRSSAAQNVTTAAKHSATRQNRPSGPGSCMSAVSPDLWPAPHKMARKIFCLKTLLCRQMQTACQLVPPLVGVTWPQGLTSLEQVGTVGSACAKLFKVREKEQQKPLLFPRKG